MIDARGFYYSDQAGLSVTTAAASLEQPVDAATSLEAVGLIERTQIGAPDDSDPALAAAAGHQHGSPSLVQPEVDVISSASTTARVQGDKTLLRHEVQLRWARGVGSKTAPADVGLEARYSSEPDYLSLGAALSGRVDLFERNLTVAGFLSVARDRVDPESPPPGQAGAWPAAHERIYLGASLAQVLGPTTVLAGSATFGRQAGTLESPYRRVLVRTSLFPESVPDERFRVTASLSVAQYLGSGFAAHLRNGVYGDSWGVAAWIPELALAKELGPRLLASVHARRYAQSAATFYEHHYDDLERYMTADVRLSSLGERAAGVHVAFVLWRTRNAGDLSLNASYERSWLEYREHRGTVVGDLLSAGVVWEP
jgi:hypothetical protein